MPTQSLLPFVESPDGLMQETLSRSDANTPGAGSSMTPHGSCLEKTSPTAMNPPISCMFCDETFVHQEELGPHVLTRHPTTFPEPAVLRVEAEFRIPGERNRQKATQPAAETEEELHSCIVCGQVARDSLELENHMRKHKEYFSYCCSVCGRRFKEPWFLKAHMKMHTKSSSKNKAAQEPDLLPATINDVTQDGSEPVTTVYKMCMFCGFFFPDRESLVEHSKIHNREDRNRESVNTAKKEVVEKETFIQGLNLRPSSKAESMNTEPVRTSKWIAQLDPFNTYQAWQLATKGKIAVGPNIVKDLGQEASTDNEDSTSDKDELNGGFAEGPAADKAAGKDGVVTMTLPKRRSLIQKDVVHKSKERPTTCGDCQRTFRTYHQLVLHSRIHKRDRVGEEIPLAAAEAKLPRGGSLEQEEVDEGLEEATLTETLVTGEDGFERVKGRSKECSYCGKSFRSSYYLTVHLRTHTGEKPYKCAYCDYAAAQKTSLKYHLDRRHKDRPYVELPLRPALRSPALDLKLEADSENSSSPTKLWIEEATKPFPQTLLDCKPQKLTTTSTTNDALLNLPMNLKVEKHQIKDKAEESPLNLSLNVSLTVSSGPADILAPHHCPQCVFKTVYPEVLTIHRRLMHKDKSDVVRRPVLSRLKRHTGCPPALDGKDVAPLPMIFRSHPRRTKSPNAPATSKPQTKTTADATKAATVSKASPARDEDKQNNKCRLNREQKQVNPEPAVRFVEAMKRPSPGAKYLLEMPPERIGIGERTYNIRNGVLWPQDTARMCLSARFGSLPRMDLGEPSNKRPKYSSTPQDGPEKATFRSMSAETANRLMNPGRSHQAPLAAVPDSLKSTSVTLGGALDSDWSTMSLLHSYTLNDLATLYHTAPGNASRAGGRTLLYQPLPTLPNLQRREMPGPYTNQRYGTADKSA